MSWVAGFFGFLVLTDAFGAKHFNTRQEWEAGLGIFLILVALVMYVVEIKHDR